MASTIRIRLGAHNLTQPQTDGLRQAFAAIKGISDTRGFQYIAGLHGEPSWHCWHYQANAPNVSHLQLFPPWHRAYLYTLERSLRDQVPETMLPWWDWTLRPPRQNGLPEIFAAPAPNPLHDYHIQLDTSRGRIDWVTARYPLPANRLPTQADVDACLRKTVWTDFCIALSEIHDRVHGWVRGDMGQVSTAAFDPVFWAHHTMIDRLWRIWQSSNGNGGMPPNLLDAALPPFNLRVRDVLNVESLGYDYAAARRRVALP